MTLLIDNYDSFSYNLYQYLGEFDHDIKVIRNDEMTVEEIKALKPSRVIISPGPGRPEDAGIIVQAAKELGRSIPLLGICLGHQAICLSFGATVTYAKQMMHGKQSVIELDSSCPLFYGLVKRIEVARYHSLAADSSTIPEELKVTAVTGDGEVMAVEHKEYPIYGLQFHPESIMTPAGKEIIKNFINISGGKTK
ncbi:MAG: aminodeoxychorismate/anthranilate synthase component II [Lachnospiraceae bacterium]|jgi:anthranilate synthase component 2|nr:aminodeoxychorismate/anthranilate synthase component II [Lachnospiraceae bacterium]